MIQIDMEMPENCFKCPLYQQDGTCNILNIWNVVATEGRLEDCPLKEVNDKPSGITTKQLEAMYESYKKSLWREREDIRGDDMVLLSDTMAFLQEELCMLGCWDDEEQGETE